MITAPYTQQINAPEFAFIKRTIVSVCAWACRKRDLLIKEGIKMMDKVMCDIYAPQLLDWLYWCYFKKNIKQQQYGGGILTERKQKLSVSFLFAVKFSILC